MEIDTTISLIECREMFAAKVILDPKKHPDTHAAISCENLDKNEVERCAGENRIHAKNASIFFKTGDEMLIVCIFLR